MHQQLLSRSIRFGEITINYIDNISVKNQYIYTSIVYYPPHQDVYVSHIVYGFFRMFLPK